MNKICIIGSPGSGKSTLAMQLGEMLGIKICHLDFLFWKPGWVGSTMDELKRAQAKVLAKDSWIIDGNYSATWDVRLHDANTIIFLDIPKWIRLYRVIKRYFAYRHKIRPDTGKNCPEKLDLSFLKVVWTHADSRRFKALEVIEKYKDSKETFIIKNNKDMSKLFSRIKVQTT